MAAIPPKILTVSCFISEEGSIPNNSDGPRSNHSHLRQLGNHGRPWHKQRARFQQIWATRGQDGFGHKSRRNLTNQSRCTIHSWRWRWDGRHARLSARLCVLWHGLAQWWRGGYEKWEHRSANTILRRRALLRQGVWALGRIIIIPTRFHRVVPVKPPRMKSEALGNGYHEELGC